MKKKIILLFSFLLVFATIWAEDATLFLGDTPFFITYPSEWKLDDKGDETFVLTPAKGLSMYIAPIVDSASASLVETRMHRGMKQASETFMKFLKSKFNVNFLTSPPIEIIEINSDSWPLKYSIIVPVQLKDKTKVLARILVSYSSDFGFWCIYAEAKQEDDLLNDSALGSVFSSLAFYEPDGVAYDTIYFSNSALALDYPTYLSSVENEDHSYTIYEPESDDVSMLLCIPLGKHTANPDTQASKMFTAANNELQKKLKKMNISITSIVVKGELNSEAPPYTYIYEANITEAKEKKYAHIMIMHDTNDQLWAFVATAKNPDQLYGSGIFYLLDSIYVVKAVGKAYGLSH